MTTTHPNQRLETFCDGVFAIAITLLIIDVRIPVTTAIGTTADLWLALKHLLPSMFAFVLSFGIIFINWVNHHEAMRLVEKSSQPFIYANGFLMLGVVFVPFPTALLGENLLTRHASPAVVLYSLAGAIMAVGWALVSRAALEPEPLTRNERAAARVRKSARNAHFAIAFYATCAIVAVWLPLAIAVVITVMWLYWVIYGIRSVGDSRD
ncbi:MAG TPA: TMEM175 family protein [Candidatus Eisenbacteria bacterium]|nr:TMEM175 family protein [Candidatus Eisenbacteria bacterium]